MDPMKSINQHILLPTGDGKAPMSAPSGHVDGVILSGGKKMPLFQESSLPRAVSSEDPQPVEFPRPMTDDEKQDFKTYFPKLDVDKAVVTADATPEYNCISWTVGETHQWFWPPEMHPDVSENEAFDRFYDSYGFKPSETGEVARWRNDEGLTHGCVSGPEHGPRWESKCGAALRIQHDLNELESDIYGHVDGFYAKKEGGAPPMAAYKPVDIPAEVISGVKEIAAQVQPEAKEKFDEAYSRWLEFRKSPGVRLSGNPADYTKTKAFEEIVGLGAEVIPLLMEKITQGDFFARKAVERMSQESGPYQQSMVPELAVSEHNNSEQNKAALMLIKWFKST